VAIGLCLCRAISATRPAYREACEDSIYVAPDALGRGVGGALLTALLDGAAVSGFREMLAVIGGASRPRSRCTRGSASSRRGGMRNVGIKFGAGSTRCTCSGRWHCKARLPDMRQHTRSS